MWFLARVVLSERLNFKETVVSMNHEHTVFANSTVTFDVSMNVLLKYFTAF